MSRKRLQCGFPTGGVDLGLGHFGRTSLPSSVGHAAIILEVARLKLPTRFHNANRHALGITIPPLLLNQADEVTS